MSTFNDWLDQPGALDTLPAYVYEDAAYAVHQVVMDRPSPVILRRGQTNLPVQTLRVEVGNGSITRTGGFNAMPGEVTVVIFGWIGYPGQPDCDIARGDTCVIDKNEYTIEVVVTMPGGLQGFGRVKA